MSITDIKPCPFCGSSEIKLDENTMWTGRRYQTLSYFLHHRCTDQFKSILITVKAKTKEETIELWNKRYEKDSTIS